jgi:hypothetical protein
VCVCVREREREREREDMHAHARTHARTHTHTCARAHTLSLTHTHACLLSFQGLKKEQCLSRLQALVFSVQRLKKDLGLVFRVMSESYPYLRSIQILKKV